MGWSRAEPQAARLAGGARWAFARYNGAVHIDELDYELPEERIAQVPLERRDASRLLVVDAGGRRHEAIADLPELLQPSLIVLNDTRVIPARLLGQRPTGGRVELLLVERLGILDRQQERWTALGRASKSLREGAELLFGEGALRARVLGRDDAGLLQVELSAQEGSVAEAIAELGRTPLPPYIRRPADEADVLRYQTLWARHEGAVAAPTAGLHLSEELLGALERAGHRFAYVTLHVGLGTFKPVEVDDLDAHPMHEERFEVSEATARAIVEAKREGRPVLAIGTTVVRALESAAEDDGALRVGAGRTDLLIQPPYRFRVIDHLLTNFHQPRSTLLALVMAFAGVDAIRAAYEDALQSGYRFLSYGDAMLLRPAARAERAAQVAEEAAR